MAVWDWYCCHHGLVPDGYHLHHGLAFDGYRLTPRAGARWLRPITTGWCPMATTCHHGLVPDGYRLSPRAGARWLLPVATMVAYTSTANPILFELLTQVSQPSLMLQSLGRKRIPFALQTQPFAIRSEA